MATDKRIKYIDIFKSIGIVIMIAGHIGFGKSFDIWIHAFHMPIFFFISGFLFKAYDFTKFIQRKVTALLLPYLGFGVFNYIIYCICSPKFNSGKYIEQFFFFNNKSGIVGALWFLTTLFFLNIIFYILNKYFRKNKLWIVILMIVTFEYILKIRLPYSIDSALYMLPVFYFGYIFKDIQEHIKPMYRYVTVTIPILIYPLIMHNGYVNIRLNTYSNIFIFYFCAFMMSISLFFISQLIDKINYKNIFSYIGKNSLNYMCLNQVVIMLLLMIGLHIKIVILLVSLLVLALCTVSINFIKTTKFLSCKTQK